jgi:preprotein translocase subunit SecY
VGLEGAGNVVSGMFFRLSTAITLTGGTMFLMWLGGRSPRAASVTASR